MLMQEIMYKCIILRYTVEKKSKLRPDSSNKFARTKYGVLLRIVIFVSIEEL